MAAPPKSVTLLIDYLSQEPLPSEVDIAILGADSEASSYPDRAFAKVETHLGIHAPDLPRLAREFREEYAMIRQSCGGGGGRGGGGSGTTTADYSSMRMLDTTACLLLVCPDHSTAWADRRRALLGNTARVGECALRKELEFCNLLFTRHSKAPSSWAHRKWIGKMLVDLISKSIDASTIEGRNTSNKLHQWAASEIATCSSVAEQYPKNYHAWTHRRWSCQMLFDLFKRATSNSNGCNNPPLIAMVFDLLRKELTVTQTWMTTHVTDHSALNYRLQVLKMLLEVGMHPASECMLENDTRSSETNNVASVWAWNLLSETMEIARSSRYPSYEVTWIHRRMCGLECLSFLEDQIPGNYIPDLNQFVEAEVRDLAATYLNHSSCRKSKIYALSYVVWIVKQMKCSNKLWKTCPGNELENLEMEVITLLAHDKTIPGNYWRIMNDRMP